MINGFFVVLGFIFFSGNYGRGLYKKMAFLNCPHLYISDVLYPKLIVSPIPPSLSTHYGIKYFKEIFKWKKNEFESIRQHELIANNLWLG